MPRKTRSNNEQPELSLTDLLRKASSDLRLSAAKPNMLMYVPHDKQMDFHRNFNREKLFIGGNRSGKTVSNVMECIWWATKKHPYRDDVNNIEGEVRGRYVSTSFADGILKVALPYFKQFLPTSELIGGSWEKSYSKQEKTLYLKNGSFIEFMSYDQDLDKFAGTSRHFIAYDEEPPQAIFIECRMRLNDTKGSWWISMTPVEGMTWIYDIIYEPVENGTRNTFVIEIDSTENPHVDDEEIEASMEGLDEREKTARKKGKFIEIGGRVYKTFNPAIHRAPEFHLTPDMRVWTSYDHGWRHPAAWLWHAVKPNGKVVTFHEIIVSEKTVKELADEVHRYEREYLGSKGMEVYLRVADPACNQTSAINGMSITQTYALEGIFLATDIPKSVAVGLDKVQQYLKIDPDPSDPIPYWRYHGCPILERQMSRLHWDKYASRKMEYENAPKETIHKKDDDGPDSLRYFFTLMPDLTFEVGSTRKEKENPLNAVPYASPSNSYAGFNGEMAVLADSSDRTFTIYEDGDIYSLENC